MRPVLALSLLLASSALGKEPTFKGLLLVSDSDRIVQEGIPSFRGLQIQGVEIPGTLSSLQQTLEPLFVNQSLTDERLLLLQKTIVNYFKERGHPLVFVEIPFQDVTEGSVQFIVRESRLGKIVSKANRWFSDRLLTSYIEIKPGDLIDTEVLLKDISWMNQNPFHFTNVVYTPGEKEGTTDLELVTKDRFPVRIYGGGDNTGLELTGTARWFTGFDWANAWGLDHILTLQGTTSTDFHRFRALTFHYTAPLPMHQTLEAYGGYSQIHPDSFPFASKGKNTQFSLRYHIPIHRSYHPRLQDVTVGFDFKNNDDYIAFSGGAGTERFARLVNITQFVAGYAAAAEFGKHKVSGNALGFASPGEIIAHQSDKAFSSQHPYAKNQYLYGRFTAAWQYEMPRKFVLDSQLRFQLSTGNLVPTEQFGLGGYDTVRGYRERTLNVDQGLCYNIEVRSPSISVLRLFGKKAACDTLTLLAFLDYGIGGNIRSFAGEPRSRYLLSIGPGLRYLVSSYLSIRFDYGLRLHRFHDHTHRGQGHVGAICNF